MSKFLDDQIMDMYDDFMSDEITATQLIENHSKTVDEKINADPTLINLKRVVLSLNLAVDRIKKKYGKSLLKHLSYEDVYNDIFNQPPKAEKL